MLFSTFACYSLYNSGHTEGHSTMRRIYFVDTYPDCVITCKRLQGICGETSSMVTFIMYTFCEFYIIFLISESLFPSTLNTV